MLAFSLVRCVLGLEIFFHKSARSIRGRFFAACFCIPAVNTFPPVNPGRLDRLVTLLAPSPTRDASGSIADEFRAAATVFAEMVEQGGREFRAAGNLNAETTAIFTLRWRADINPGWRIACGGKEWEVLAVSEVGRREFLRVQARSRAVPSIV